VGVVKVLADLAAGACALLFLAAAVGKLDSWAQWSRLSEEIPGPAPLGRAVRVMVPAIEGMIVVLSFALPAAGLAAGVVVLGGFAAAVRILAPRLAGRECNCFGAIAPATISPRLATRNIALAFLTAGGWWVVRHENLQAFSFAEVLVTLLFGVIALMLVQYRRLRQATRPVPGTLRETE
jgi:hypothetical protein